MTEENGCIIFLTRFRFHTKSPTYILDTITTVCYGCNMQKTKIMQLYQ